MQALARDREILGVVAVELRVIPSTRSDAGPPLAGDTERALLQARARMLARAGLAWHGVEAAVAIGAGVAAGSVALVAFGADSLIEALAGIVVLWRFNIRRVNSEHAERRAQRLIAITFWLLATYVAVEAIVTLARGDHPSASPIGIGLSIVTLIAMPVLASAKASVARRLGSSAGHSESRQNLLCAYLSAALLVGLTLNAILGWWWADPATALVVAAVAAREGHESWRGQSCCTTDGCCA
jgi:divalent metal cation (Fe/Co/Zn/Cd) transporter